MHAIKQLVKVYNNQVLLKLPKKFKAEEVEVIVLPVEKNRKQKTNSLSQILLDGPVFNKEEINNIKNVRRWINSWKQKKF